MLAFVFCSTASAQHPTVNARGKVNLHRQLGGLIEDIAMLEATLELIPTTAPQRQRINRTVERMRRKLSRLLAVTPARVRRFHPNEKRPIPPVPLPTAAPNDANNGTQAPAKVTPAKPRPMGKKAFAALLKTVRTESFGSGRLQVIRSASTHHHFTVKQVLSLLEQLSFSSKKLEAVRTLYPRVVNPQNAFQLYGAFTYESDKRKLRAILEN